MKPLIYGINHQALQLDSYLQSEFGVHATAFLVDGAYIQKKQKQYPGSKLVPFEQFSENYSKEDYDILLSFGYKNMMRNREEKFHVCKEKGYRLRSFISKQAVVNTTFLGEGVLIYPGCVISPYVEIGDGAFLEIGCRVAHNTKIGSFTYLSPGAMVSGDIEIGNNCFLGTGSIVTNAVKVADFSLIGAGVCITKDVEKVERGFRHAEAVALRDKSDVYI